MNLDRFSKLEKNCWITTTHKCSLIYIHFSHMCAFTRHFCCSVHQHENEMHINEIKIEVRRLADFSLLFFMIIILCCLNYVPITKCWFTSSTIDNNLEKILLVLVVFVYVCHDFTRESQGTRSVSQGEPDREGVVGESYTYISRSDYNFKISTTQHSKSTQE